MRIGQIVSVTLLSQTSHSLTFRLAALSPPLWCLLPHWLASLTLCSCGANNTNPSVHGSDLVNRKIVGRERWGYHSCQIPGQSGHFVWGKDLALSQPDSHSIPLEWKELKKAEQDLKRYRCCSVQIQSNALFFHYSWNFTCVQCVSWLIRHVHIHYDFSCHRSESNLFVGVLES